MRYLGKGQITMSTQNSSDVLFLTFSSGKNQEGKYSEIYQAGERLIAQAKSSRLFSNQVHLDWKEISLLCKKYNYPQPDTSLNYLFTPYLMNFALEGEFGFHDYYFYAGAGCEIVTNRFAFPDFQRILRTSMREGAYLEGTRYLEAAWTKAEVIRRLSPDNEVLNSGQVMATFFVVSSQSKRFDVVKQVMKSWLDISTEKNFFYIRDDHESASQSPLFIAHRNDQSLLSILSKQAGISIQSEQRRGFAPPLAAVRGSTRFLWVSRNRSGKTSLPTGVNSSIVGLLGLVLLPLFQMHQLFQDKFSKRVQYLGFPGRSIVKSSNFVRGR